MSEQHATRVRVKPGIYRRLKDDGTPVHEVVYRDSEGRKRRESVGPRMKDAEARLAQVKADMSRGARVVGRQTLTVADAAEVWLAASEHLRPATVRGYRGALDAHVLPAFGHRRLEAVSPDDVAAWLRTATTVAYARQHRRAKPYRAGTIRRALLVLHRVYSHAIRRQGFAGSSPVAALERQEKPTDAEPKRITILTPEEVAALLTAAEALDAEPGRYSRGRTAYAPILAFMAATGVRVGEALGLTWTDVDLSERTARIAMQCDRQGHRVALKTSNGRRTVDLPGALVARLAALKLASTDTRVTAFVFASPMGGPLDARNVAQRGLTPACQAAGVPVVSPHALRHAHASALLADGWELPAVSRRLGHGSVAITASTYAHLLDSAARRQERRDRLDGLYGAGASSRG